MTRTERPDPLDELRQADPVLLNRPPSDSKARVRARIEEATMEDTRHTRPQRPGWVLGLAGAAVAGVAVAAFALNNGGAPSPTSDPGTGIGSCVEAYSIETLGYRDFAFDGIVTSIHGDRVSFEVNEGFIGEVDGEMTLTASGMSGTSITSAGGASLSVGSRYLVAGDDDFAWACGFTQPYDDAIAAEWTQAAR